MGRVSDTQRSEAGRMWRSGAAFWVSDWEVRPRDLVLRRREAEQRLEPRVMALLVELAAHAGEVVSRDELLDRVWSDVTVSDDAVHTAVSKLRRALGNGEGRRVIETVPKSGYRLVAVVRRHVSNGTGADPQLVASAIVPEAASTRPHDTPPPAGLPSDTTKRFGRSRQALASAISLLVVVASGLAVVFGWIPLGVAPRPEPVKPELRPITSWAGLEVGPTFAPGNTGDRVAFSWKGPDQTNWDIWVQLVGEGDPLRLTTDPAADYDPAWSPDGKRVAFFRDRNGRCEVLQVAALGGAERRLAECAKGEDLTWSPDGTRLLWADRSDEREPVRIVEVVLETGERRAVTSPPTGSIGDFNPVVSSDGETLAFQRSPVLGVHDIYLKSLAGGPIRRLTTDNLKIHGLDWTPDGDDLVFASNRTGLFSLWRVSASGGAPVWLGVSGQDLDEPSVGAGGRLIAFEQWNDDTNIYRVALNGEPVPHRVLGSSRWDWRPHVSSDGRRVVFVSDRTGAPELWSAELGARRPARRLTEMGGPYVDRPRYSPSGDAVVFDARPDANADVYVLDTGSFVVRRLTTHAAQDVAGAWSRDGRHIYFASDRSGAWQIWRVAVGGGEPVQVTTAGGFFAQESDDARWLYFSRRHEPGIWRQPRSAGGRAAGSVERITTELAPLDRSHFAVTREALVFIRRRPHDRSVLSRLTLDGRALEDIGDLGRVPYNSGLALGRDRGSVLFTRVDRLESDILVLDRGR